MAQKKHDGIAKVGFVGLGDQGAPIAKRILDAGYDLVVYARRPVQVEELAASGAEVADSLERLAERSDLLAVCVGDDTDLEDICPTALKSMRPGCILVIHSTVHPDLIRRISDEAQSRGIAVLDAPVSGGRIGAVAGTMTVMVGGDAAAFAAARPVFETFGRLIVHAGGPGSGQIVKLVNQYLLAAQIDVVSQIVEIIQALRLDPEPVLGAIATSTGTSGCIQWLVNDWILHDDGSVNVFPGMHHNGGGLRAAQNFAKDIRHARDVFSRAAGPLPERLDSSVVAGIELSLAEGARGDAEMSRPSG